MKKKFKGLLNKGYFDFDGEIWDEIKGETGETSALILTQLTNLSQFGVCKYLIYKDNLKSVVNLQWKERGKINWLRVKFPT